MAVESVIATIADESKNLAETSTNTYSGELTAPLESGDYSIDVAVYDDAGNVAVAASEVVEVSIWHTPKTDWTSTDRFNYVDYNRIKNNLSWLHAKAMELWKTFEIEDMGEDILSYKERFFAYQFNRFENNLDKINQSILTKDYGYTQTFVGNGKFITYDELNRIENAILNMKNILDNQEKGIKKLSFRLGAFKEVKI